MERTCLPKRKPRGPDKKPRKQRSDTKPKSWHQYNQHKGNAIKGGVPFLLSYEEWLAIWEESGHLEERGCRSGQYVMGRIGDKGPYAVGNVHIITVTGNNKEQWDNPATRTSMIEKTRVANTGKKRTPESREKMRNAKLGKKQSVESRRKKSESMKVVWRKRKEEATRKEDD